MHRLVRILIIASALMLASCASVGELGPYNVKSEGADPRLMLDGFDPVAYHLVGKSVRGDSAIKADYDGVTYRFVSADNKAAFLKEPTRYVPQNGGFCSNGIVYGIPWGGDGDTWRLIDGKLFIFGGARSRDYFMMDEKKNLALAAEYCN